jgi:hypothetical protein
MAGQRCCEKACGHRQRQRTWRRAHRATLPDQRYRWYESRVQARLGPKVPVKQAGGRQRRAPRDSRGDPRSWARLRSDPRRPRYEAGTTAKSRHSPGILSRLETRNVRKLNPRFSSVVVVAQKPAQSLTTTDPGTTRGIDLGHDQGVAEPLMVSLFVVVRHRERHHQGLGNELITPATAAARGTRVRCRDRLGGLLRYDHRATRIGISFRSID